MSMPDEIFVNPKQPEDVSFGNSIVATLTGANGNITGSYIKTDRIGEMTHFINSNNFNQFPLRNYKCYPVRFLKEDRLIDTVPISAVFNTGDAFAQDVNNLDSYGDRITSTDTLIDLPTSPNPPSVVLPTTMDYCEIQLDTVLQDLTFNKITYIEFTLNVAMARSFMFRIATSTTPDDITIPWTQITDQPALLPDELNLPGDPVNTQRYGLDVSTEPDAASIRVRIMHADMNDQGPMTVKINHILVAGEPSS